MKCSEMKWIAVFAAIATAEALTRLGIEQVSLKWPNDVLVNGEKIAGILVEPRVGQSSIQFVIVGIGINVKQSGSNWCESFDTKATSIKLQGIDVECEQVVKIVLKRLDRWYVSIRKKGTASLAKAWNIRSEHEIPA